MNRYQFIQCASIGIFSIILMVVAAQLPAIACSELYGCASGSICVDGACKVICNGDADCSEGDRCRLGVCVPPSELTGCGNGFVDPEECDDANVDNTDSCLNSCVSAVCGDGFIQRGAEECDLGSGLNQDDGACTSTCQQAVCGDGFIYAGVETCDEGENNSDDWALKSVAIQPAMASDLFAAIPL